MVETRNQKNNIANWILQQQYINENRELALEYVAQRSKLTQDEQRLFVNCFLQKNTVESTAFKLNKDIKEIEMLYTRLSVHLATVNLLKFQEEGN